MFAYCGNLKQITCYSRNNLWGNNRAPYNWVKGVSSTGVFIKHPNADWPVGDSGIPSGWTNYVDPLTLEAAGDGTLTINNPRNLSITYSKDASMAMGTTTSLATISIPVSAGDKVRLWGNNAVYSGYDNGLYDESMNTTISGSAPHYVYGDIRSLVSSSNYPNLSSLSAYAFAGLFQGNDKLKSHPTEKLVIRPSTLGTGCFKDMFNGCTALERAPELPATTLAPNCYGGMFYGCTALKQAPDLPATTLADFCYMGMFHSCSSLQNPPAISAQTLATACCMNMFSECTSLKESPALTAGTLEPYCYSMMFSSCTSLKKITCTASNISAGNALMNWVDGVPSGAGGTFVKKSGVDWPPGSSGIPSGWTVQQQ